MITLGSTVKDKVTGFQGTATSRTEWLNGSTRVAVDRLNDKNEIFSWAFEEERLEVVQETSA